MFKLLAVIEILSILVLLTKGHNTEIKIINRESDTLWIAFEPNGSDQIANGGFVLKSGKSKTVSIPVNWYGYIWGRTHCNSSTNICLTGNCQNGLHCLEGDGHGAYSYIIFRDIDGLKAYSVSGSRGFNLPLGIEPILDVNITARGDYYCRPSLCKKNLNDDCPLEYRVYHKNTVIGCQGPCEAFDTDEYCCREDYKSIEACLSTVLPEDYVVFFKSRCPHMVLHHYELAHFRCRADKYVITFGNKFQLDSL